MQKDVAGMAKQPAFWLAGKPGVEDFLLFSEADTAAIPGCLGRPVNELARRWLRLSARRQDQTPAADAAQLCEKLFMARSRNRSGRRLAVFALSTARTRKLESRSRWPL